MSLRKQILLKSVSFIAAACLWLPLVHVLYTPSMEEFTATRGVSPRAQTLAKRHIAIWSGDGVQLVDIQAMRAMNAEWDFMGRTFVVLSMANMGLRDPQHKTELLGAIDHIIEDTLDRERQEGMHHFLMPYARRSPWAQRPARSLFLDGEIALMLAARRMLEEKAEYKALLTERVNLMAARMAVAPVVSGESYPNECWTFCNTVALAAIRMADHLDGSDHSDLLRRWVNTAKEKLIHKPTGLLVSSYTYSGQPLDGPEGSSIWMAAHCLLLIDEEFARDQYARAKRELAGRFLGFGYAREWPESWLGPEDIDSGPTAPFLRASASSSGLACVAAKAFGDHEFLVSLHTSVDFAGFPHTANGALKYLASNQVGDAVLLYSTVFGPLWDTIRQEQRR